MLNISKNVLKPYIQFFGLSLSSIDNLIFVNRKFGRSFVNNYINLVNSGEFAKNRGRNFPVLSDVYVCSSSRFHNNDGNLIDCFSSVSITDSDQHLLYGLENGRTLIPEGLYEVDLTYSPKFNRELPILLNVPERDGIRIHPGNYAKDSAGCILLGLESCGHYIQSSAFVVAELITYLRNLKSSGERMFIFVTNDYSLRNFIVN